MRAFALESLGEPGSVRDLPDPEPKDGEVLVRIRAAGVNVFDAWVVLGAMKDAMEHRFPLVPGVEASGVVEATGAGVTAFTPGDEVYGVSVKPFLGEGTFAQLATFDAGGLSPKPRSVAHASAAALPHTALTALTVIDEIEPREGQVVLVVGATGGVGSSVTQLAASRGAKVIAVASAERADYARELGASETIDYTKGDLRDLVRAAHPGGVDALVDFSATGQRSHDSAKSCGPAVLSCPPAAPRTPSCSHSEALREATSIARAPSGSPNSRGSWTRSNSRRPQQKSST